VPFTVTVDVPVVAFAAAVRVSVDVFVVGLGGSNAAVTPVGRPSAERVTAPVKPPLLVMLTVWVAVPPCVAVTVALATARVYVGVGAATTVIATAAVAAVTPVPVAFTVALMTPGAADPATPNVMTADDADAPIVVGVDVKFTVPGSPSTVSATSPANPPERVRLTVTVPVVPCVTLSALDESAMLIAGVGSVPPSSPPLHAASATAALTAVMSFVTASIPTRTLPPDMMKGSIRDTVQSVCV
jgi:hypothetical protein